MSSLGPDSKIYIAGDRGMVGAAIKRALNKRGYTNLVGVTRDVLDLTDQNSVRTFFQLNFLQAFW